MVPCEWEICNGRKEELPINRKTFVRKRLRERRQQLHCYSSTHVIDSCSFMPHCTAGIRPILRNILFIKERHIIKSDSAESFFLSIQPDWNQSVYHTRCSRSLLWAFHLPELSSGCWKLQHIRLNGSLLDWEPLWEKKEKMSVTERMGTAQKDSESIALESERVKIVWESKEVEKYGFKLVCLYRPFPHKAWLLLSKMDFQWQCIRYCIKQGTLCYPAAKIEYILQNAGSLLHSSHAFHKAAGYFVRSSSWLFFLVCLTAYILASSCPF